MPDPSEPKDELLERAHAMQAELAAQASKPPQGRPEYVGQVAGVTTEPKAPTPSSVAERAARALGADRAVPAAQQAVRNIQAHAERAIDGATATAQRAMSPADPVTEPTRYVGNGAFWTGVGGYPSLVVGLSESGAVDGVASATAPAAQPQAAAAPTPQPSAAQRALNYLRGPRK